MFSKFYDQFQLVQITLVCLCQNTCTMSCSARARIRGRMASKVTRSTFLSNCSSRRIMIPANSKSPIRTFLSIAQAKSISDFGPFSPRATDPKRYRADKPEFRSSGSFAFKAEMACSRFMPSVYRQFGLKPSPHARRPSDPCGDCHQDIYPPAPSFAVTLVPDEFDRRQRRRFRRAAFFGELVVEPADEVGD